MAEPTVGRTVRPARRRLVTLVVVLAVAALVAWLPLTDAALQRQLEELTARNLSLEQTLRAQQLQTARASLLADDLSAVVGDQAALLESTDGFLK